MDTDHCSLISDTTMGTNQTSSPLLLSSLQMLKVNRNNTRSPEVGDGCASISIMSSPTIPMMSQNEKYKLERFLDEESDNGSTQPEDNLHLYEGQSTSLVRHQNALGSLDISSKNKSASACTTDQGLHMKNNADTVHVSQRDSLSHSASDNGDERSQSLLPQVAPIQSIFSGSKIVRPECPGFSDTLQKNVSKSQQDHTVKFIGFQSSQNLSLPQPDKSPKSSLSSSSLSISSLQITGNEKEVLDKIKKIHTHIDRKLEELSKYSLEEKYEKVSKYKENLSSLQPLLTKINETHKVHRKCLMDKFRCQKSMKERKAEMKQELQSLEDRQKTLLKLFQKHKLLGMEVKRQLEVIEKEKYPINDSQIQLFSQLTASGSEQQHLEFSQQTFSSMENKSKQTPSEVKTSRKEPSLELISQPKCASTLQISSSFAQTEEELDTVKTSNTTQVSVEHQIASSTVLNVNTSFDTQVKKSKPASIGLVTTKRKADTENCAAPTKISSIEVNDDHVQILGSNHYSPAAVINCSEGLHLNSVSKASCTLKSPPTIVFPSSSRKTFLSPIASTTDTSDIFPVKSNVIAQRLSQKFGRGNDENMEIKNSGRRDMCSKNSVSFATTSFETAITKSDKKEITHPSKQFGNDAQTFIQPASFTHGSPIFGQKKKVNCSIATTNKKYPTLKMLLDQRCIESGSNNISLVANGQEYAASLGRDGVIITDTGGRFKTPMGWLSYITEGKMFKRVTAYKRVKYRGKPLSAFVLCPPPTQVQNKDIEKKMTHQSQNLVVTEECTIFEAENKIGNKEFTHDLSTENLNDLPANDISVNFENITLSELLLNCKIKLIGNRELTNGCELPDDFWTKPYKDIIFSESFINEIFE